MFLACSKVPVCPRYVPQGLTERGLLQIMEIVRGTRQSNGPNQSSQPAAAGVNRRGPTVKRKGLATAPGLGRYSSQDLIEDTDTDSHLTIDVTTARDHNLG